MTNGIILSARPTQVWHFTCEHGRQAIGGVGQIFPLRAMLTTNVLDTQEETTKRIASLAWFTTVGDITTREEARSIGLHSTETLKCERWTHRYRVGKRSIKNLVSWQVERVTWPEHIRQALEHATAGIEPQFWWVSASPVPVFYDPVPAGTRSRIVRVNG